MRRLAISLLLVGCFWGSGCSVGMALSGKRNPELAAVHKGATRGEVELQLGSPVEVVETGDKRVDIYEYEIGNEVSAGRAIGHGVMDILTLGLWEIAGTPIEGIQGEKKYLRVEYDEDDVVSKIGPDPGRAKKAKPKPEPTEMRNEL